MKNAAQICGYYCRRAFFCLSQTCLCVRGMITPKLKKHLHLDQEVHLELAPGKTLLETEKVKIEADTRREIAEKQRLLLFARHDNSKKEQIEMQRRELLALEEEQRRRKEEIVTSSQV